MPRFHTAARKQADFDTLRRTLQNDLDAQVKRYLDLKMQVMNASRSGSRFMFSSEFPVLL